MSTGNDDPTPSAASNQPQAGAADPSGSVAPRPDQPAPSPPSPPAAGDAQQAPRATAAAPEGVANTVNNREGHISSQVVGNGSVTINNNNNLTVEALAWAYEKGKSSLEEEKRSLEERLFQRIDRNDERIKGLVGDLSARNEQARRRAVPQTGLLPISEQELPKTVEAYAIYFEQLDYEEKLFVALLCLFPGIGWMDYWVIYGQAHELIIPKLTSQNGKRKGKKVGPEKQPPHLRSELYWEQVAHAVVSQIPQTYDEGNASPTTVDFLPEIRPLVEKALSTRHRRWLFELAPLLHALGHHRFVEIRRMAGEAAATLANIDWDYVRRTIIEPWSRDNSTETRAAAGYTFDAMVRTRINDGYAIYLLNRWSNPMGSFYWRQCWTATAAYKLIGLERYEDAAKDLRNLAALADTILGKYGKSNAPLPSNLFERLEVVDAELMDDLPPAVSYALVYLASAGKTQEVISTLREWAAAPQEKGSWRIFWDMIIFTTLYDIGEGAFALRKDKDKNKVEKQQDFFVLLQDAQEFRRYLADVLCYLYRQSPENRRVVIIVLQNWIEHLDEMKLSTDPVSKIIKRMFRFVDGDLQQGPHRDRLLRAMQRWTNHKNAAVKAVGAVVVQSILGGPPRLPGPSTPPKEPPDDGRIVFGKH